MTREEREKQARAMRDRDRPKTGDGNVVFGTLHGWIIDEVHQYNTNNDLPEMTDEEAADFLDDIEDRLVEAMSEIGQRKLEEALDERAEEHADVDE